MGVLHVLLVSVFNLGVILWFIFALEILDDDSYKHAKIGLLGIRINMLLCKDLHEEFYCHHTESAMYSMNPCPPQNLSKDLPESEAFARPLGMSR